MIVIAGLVAGSITGALIAARRKGNWMDIAQYAAGYGIAFTLVGLIVTVILERTLG